MPSSAKPTLAVALIVKNEAKNLEACLNTVADWVDEIVVLDSGSTDETEQVAREYTEKFHVNKDWPGFGPQRR
ncbi:glycosyltransferase, partial [Vibrio fortis]